MLVLRQVSKSFGNTPVIRDVSLRVDRGSTVVLIGPSGCGKSTLLRLMIGLIAPDAGQVLVAPHDAPPGDQPDASPEDDDAKLQVLDYQSARTLRRSQIGYVIQDGGLFPHLTARQNVTLMARELKWPDADITARLETLTQLTDFPADGLDRYPVEISGGQRQRVALMRALMLDPDVLLMDEPLGALDPMIRFDLQNDLRAIFRRLNKTVVMVTHDLAEAAFFADRIVLMRDGQIVQEGTAADLSDNPADEFVTQFVRAQRAHTFEGVAV